MLTTGSDFAVDLLCRSQDLFHNHENRGSKQCEDRCNHQIIQAILVTKMHQKCSLTDT